MKTQDVIEELESIQRDYSPNPPEPLQRLIDKLKAAPPGEEKAPPQEKGKGKKKDEAHD